MPYHLDFDRAGGLTALIGAVWAGGLAAAGRYQLAMLALAIASVGLILGNLIVYDEPEPEQQPGLAALFGAGRPGKGADADDDTDDED